MSIYQDLDIYGRDNANGTPIIYYTSEAIKNALTLWISSKKGDYLMKPFSGGALDNAVFKTLNNETLSLLRFSILDEITNGFYPEVEVLKIDMIPDYNNRILEIQIYYKILTENLIDTVTIFTNTQYSVINFEYEIVEYTEFNLYEFVRVKKPAQSSSRLIYDYDLNSWKWGKFKLVNLVPTDSYFTDILEICNGS